MRSFCGVMEMCAFYGTNSISTYNDTFHTTNTDVILCTIYGGEMMHIRCVQIHYTKCCEEWAEKHIAMYSILHDT